MDSTRLLSILLLTSKLGGEQPLSYGYNALSVQRTLIKLGTLGLLLGHITLRRLLYSRIGPLLAEWVEGWLSELQVASSAQMYEFIRCAYIRYIYESQLMTIISLYPLSACAPRNTYI